MNDLLQDIAFAWRNALKKPAIALLIVVTLALGIGANTAMFSMAWHVLLAPLPYKDGDRLVKLEQHEPRNRRLDFSWSDPTLDDFRDQDAVFSDLLEYVQLPFTAVGNGDPQQVSGGVINWKFFDVLGIRPLLGRSFISGDDVMGAEPVLLLSYEFWSNKFGADPGVLGMSLEIKNISYRIIGILPRIPSYPHYNDIWIPTASDPYRLFSWTDTDTNRESGWTFLALGKLQDGISPGEADSAVHAVAQRLRSSYPDAYAEDYLIEANSLQDEMVGSSATTFLLLLGLAFLIALIASANVANLSLARLVSRNQELAIREALGASRGRIACLLLTESMLFAAVGGMVGLVIAYPTLNLLAEFAYGFTPLASEIRMDGSIVLFSAGIAVITGFVSGSAAMFSRRDINAALKEGGDKVTTAASGIRKKQLLLAVQFALAFVALTTSALITHSLYQLDKQDSGYEPAQVLAANLMINVNFDESGQSAVLQYRNFSRRLLAATKTNPEIGMAGLFAGVPLLQDASYLGAVTFDIEGHTFASPDGRPTAPYRSASENFFSLMGIPLLKGRVFTDMDDENGTPVAMINESFAEQFFPNGDAIGQRIRFMGDPTWRSIIGIVGNLRSEGLDQVEGASAYYSYWQYPTEVISLYMKSPSSPNVLTKVISEIVHGIAPRQSIENVKALDEVKAAWLAPTRLRALLISLFGILALLITLSGVIGVVSYNVSQRVREIGIHMAIGATPANIIGIFIADGLKVYVIGLLLGVVLMLAGTPFLEPLLYQTNATDVGIYLLSTLVLTLTVLGAIYLPARKAGAMSPTMALHSE